MASKLDNQFNIRIAFLDLQVNQPNVLVSVDGKTHAFLDPDGALGLLLLHQKLFSYEQSQIYQKKKSVSQVRAQRLVYSDSLKAQTLQHLKRLDDNKNFTASEDVKAVLILFQKPQAPTYLSLEQSGWFKILEACSNSKIFQYHIEQKKLEKKAMQIADLKNINRVGDLIFAQDFNLKPAWVTKHNFGDIELQSML